ncbi:MAG: crossover junction endodeoxyribonuclease RuvC [Acidobacteria bacterium]|nr:crossover junction endodeoxyribonuclease RuvC [Acidobacteriota bacterium]
MRVIGIDCGTERTGYGIVDSDGRTHRLVAAGTLKTSPHDPLPLRLLEIGEGLRKVLEQHRPTAAAIEEVFHAVNTKSALKLAHVRGAAMVVLAGQGLPVGEYSPLTIKKSVVGHGRAEKQQVQFMMRSLLGPAAPVEQPDACDALAVAICHATHAWKPVA